MEGTKIKSPGADAPRLALIPHMPAIISRMILWLDKLGRLLAHPALWRYLSREWTRYLLSWILAVAVAGYMLHHSWVIYDEPGRPDGNAGHTYIDFGGQYLMGRMLLRGRADHLYHRSHQRTVLLEVFPAEIKDPNENQCDVESLMTCFMGLDNTGDAELTGTFLSPLMNGQPLGCLANWAAARKHWQRDPEAYLAAAAMFLSARDAMGVAALGSVHQHFEEDPLKPLRDPHFPAIGGPLYPPINALYYAPLALLPPQFAYRLSQVVSILLGFLAGLGIRHISRGQIWWPLASAGVIAFPGFGDSLNLGQNAAVTLAILTWGWVIMARGRQALGGCAWGLLAFKPVWAMTFFLIPLLTGRWRACRTMVLTAAALALATLPFVGLHSWREWLKVGQEASLVYKADVKWIHLSRDILSIPRRWLDFSNNNHDTWVGRRDDFTTSMVGWALLVLFLELTIRVALSRRHQVRQPVGPGPAFLFLGAWLTCFHFMYYDLLLAALPVFLLFTDPRRYLEPRFLLIAPLSAAKVGPALTYFQPRFFSPLPLGRDGVLDNGQWMPAPLVEARPGTLWVLNRVVPTLVVGFLAVYCILAYSNFPWVTICLMGLWLWCGWLCFWERDVRMARDSLNMADAPIQGCSDKIHGELGVGDPA